MKLMGTTVLRLKCNTKLMRVKGKPCVRVHILSSFGHAGSCAKPLATFHGGNLETKSKWWYGSFFVFLSETTAKNIYFIVNLTQLV